MKSLSAAIVVASGMAGVVACGFILHDGTQIFVGFCGAATLAIGLMGWFTSIVGREQPS